MVLNGRKDIELVSVAVNGTAITADDYVLTEDTLVITKPPSGPFKLEIVTLIKPEQNTLLEGLYKSTGTFCTQACLPLQEYALLLYHTCYPVIHVYASLLSLIEIWSIYHWRCTALLACGQVCCDPPEYFNP